MIRLYLFAEGQTEQTFADNILKLYLAQYSVFMDKIMLIAHARKKGYVHRGDGQKYEPMKDDILRLLKQEKGSKVFFTTMIDLYAIAPDFPGLAEAESLRQNPVQRVGASQMCKNKERKIIREYSSRIIRGTQSCGSSDSCSEPELISSRQSSRVSIIFCISSQTERLKTDITVSICSGVPALPKCLYLLSFEDVA